MSRNQHHQLRSAPPALVALIVLLALSASGARAEGQSNTLAGTWEFRIGLVSCDTGDPIAPRFTTLHSYHRDGTLTEQGNQIAPGVHMRTTALGIWKREGGRVFRTFFKFFNFDGSSSLLSRVEVDETVELDHGGDTLTTVAIGRVFNPAGIQVATNCLAGSGTRLTLP